MKNIINQMIHDVCGKATILNIMNELYSNKIIQDSIEDLIDFILKFRKEIGENELFKTINEDSSSLIILFLNNAISKSEKITNFADDLDICAAIESLKNNCLGFRCLFSNVFDDEIIKQIAKEKLITILGEEQPYDIITGLLLVLKENYSIDCKKNTIIISNINFNIFKSNNGILNFLSSKYTFNVDFRIS
ncbi:MAG: hypothetical protein ACK5XN_12570 [Bacteroidota bacterium]